MCRRAKDSEIGRVTNWRCSCGHLAAQLALNQTKAVFTSLPYVQTLEIDRRGQHAIDSTMHVRRQHIFGGGPVSPHVAFGHEAFEHALTCVNVDALFLHSLGQRVSLARESRKYIYAFEHIRRHV